MTRSPLYAGVVSAHSASDAKFEAVPLRRRLPMCGIAGFVRLDQPAQHSLVQAMCDEIRHRGPDDEGVHVDRGCGIGMRRLSIIDLSTGHQPISNEDGTVWIVFNGEIYNYQELRAGLMARGHRFQTSSDTETLVHLYEEEGVEGLKRLRGMFAFAIWDARQSRLLLARDRFGKKPLYYAVLPTGIYFGSEISCRRQAGVPLETDPEALRLYFQFNYIPDPLTAYRAIRRVPAGAWLTYQRGATGPLLADAGAGRRTRARPDSRRGRHPRPRKVRRSRAHPHDRRRTARRVPERRHRFQFRGGIHGAPVAGTGQDVFHRLRRKPLQ